MVDGPVPLAAGLGARMEAAGAPVWRLRVGIRTLHPLITAATSLWERGGDAASISESLHGLESLPEYQGSPLTIISTTRAPFRKALEGPLDDGDHEVLHELKARGGTDYFGLPLEFSNGAFAILVVTTDRAGGFSDHDIAGFTRVAAFLAPVVEVISARMVATAVADAYLGPRTGRRVLDGRITRGDVETIDAAVFVSDIRDWTGINNRLGAVDALALANRYFELIAEAVEARGGEILKFMGDGVLAVFPSEDGGRDATAVCDDALAAARAASSGAASAEPPLNLSFGIGLHFGEVLYGNIGSKTRIDFTVLGAAVNTAARIESLCGAHGETVLMSQAFADLAQAPVRKVAEQVLKGHDRPTSVYAAGDRP